ncbi:TPA: pyridoxal phosphate-dependent aminotransferase [Streptococcus equi subsp. zooepidemicus]|uniref:pyridoxal phosphate-dependent aminotransferase n=1 Tax=Streptococcus equi TaxID=1336 RepID=UPI00197E1401|nr:pyridoxal phosphate-dependent aminotransferase [Streptococcus equi]QTZ29257.1 Asparagine--oxo-acid transaminase [Streptococcus equi subsp. zooepidemicus]HEK9987871.1 pyridoxal phosphate-dependent aminotransferase [Streptococcus equi subsp. zooepidemicus]HEL0643361.1 pyridoxal phosphate-dependent aminotransferase [Streptococcus equi subsp. zooepidemicus]HEL1124515.1 pyridoxal phosphate-dependent aminotransferase [Streptococcus equi subsp. zooepidemicus]HEL1335574.1 pyridoxal phosphate-depend
MTKLSRRVLAMEESVTLAAGARAKALKAQGHDILSLTLGEPDFITPQHIQEKAIEAITTGKASFYTVASGLPELKDAIADYMARSYGYTPTRQEIVVGTGAKYVLYAFFMAVLNPGDQVLIPTPYWVSYADQIKMVDGVPVFVQGLEENQFKVTVEQLEAARTDQTKVVLINSPSNPTGMIYSRQELEAIGNWAVQHDILILADDIYGALVYNGNQFTPISALSEAIRRQTITVNGVAKSYAMTGWRLGFAVGDADIIVAMGKIIGQTTSNVTTASQYAAIEAFGGDQTSVEEMRQAFEERLNTIYPLLNQVPGFEAIKPQGAFYFFPNVKKAMEMKGFTDVTAFTDAILEEVGLAVVSGAGFGAPENIRLSYATDLATLKEAIRRLNQFMTTDSSHDNKENE